MEGRTGGHSRGRTGDLRFHDDDYSCVRAPGIHPGSRWRLLRPVRSHGQLCPRGVPSGRAHGRPGAGGLPAAAGRHSRPSRRRGRCLSAGNLDAAPVHADYPVDAPPQGDYAGVRRGADGWKHGVDLLHPRDAVLRRRRPVPADRGGTAAGHSARPDSRRGHRNRGRGPGRRGGVQLDGRS